MSASASAAGKRFRLGQIAFDEPDRHAVERAAIRMAADHRLHIVAGVGGTPGKMAADQASRTGNEDGFGRHFSKLAEASARSADAEQLWLRQSTAIDLAMILGRLYVAESG